MFKLNKTDQEIVRILKVVFLTKKVKPLQSDHHFRLWMIRSFFAVSLFCLITRVGMGLSGKEITSEMSALFNMPVAMFFGLLFLHINNESENISLIVFVLTWVSLVIGLYV